MTTPRATVWITTAEAAEILGVSQGRVRQLAERKLIPATRRDHRFVYPLDQIQLLAQALDSRDAARGTD